MLKRCIHFFAYLLLVLIPLQGLAAANMGVCNSMMQAAALQSIAAQQTIQQSAEMPCHKHVKTQKLSAEKQQDSSHQKICKINCATLCANFSSLTVIAQKMYTMPMLSANQLVSAKTEIYVSYTSPNLQRPPIFLA